MRRLLHGIREFQKNVFPAYREHFEKLAEGQTPTTLFITCSDSRIVPHVLTQTGPGELFVLRNAGNLVPPYTAEHTGEAATIEYAVQVLKVQDIVVCGHSHCGAIKGLLRPDVLEGLPAVKKWLAYADTIRQDVTEERGSADGSEDPLSAAIKANVLVQLNHLRTYPAIAEAEAHGSITLHGCFYRFETGQVTAFDPVAGTFVPIERHSSVNQSSLVS
jgi:carbonic anhydrase